MTKDEFEKKWDRWPDDVYEHFQNKFDAKRLLADLGIVDGIEIVQDLKDYYVLTDTVEGYLKAEYLLKLQQEFQKTMDEYIK
jgi:hypothetical protein